MIGDRVALELELPLRLTLSLTNLESDGEFPTVWGDLKRSNPRTFTSKAVMQRAITPKSRLGWDLFPKYLLANDVSLAISLVANGPKPKLIKMLKNAVRGTAKFQMPKPATPRYLANRIRKMAVIP
jgi:hypothetical protein